MNRTSEQNLISPRAADILISLRDGDMALLYLYLCRTGCQDRERAGRDLFLPRQRLNEAYERLEMSGLLPTMPGPEDSAPVRTPPVAPAVDADTELPDAYTVADVKNRTEADTAFSALVLEAQMIIGRALSSPDLTRLLAIYDHLDLPPEVMMELMHHVADCYREKYGESRRPSVRAFEKEAKVWASRGISDFDGAERYIRMQQERRRMEGAIKEAMGISGRDFTDTERRYLTLWLDWGFGAETIGLAYDKTVTNTRKFSPAYMSRILQSWHEKGLHTLHEIQDKDRPARGRIPSGSAAGAASRQGTDSNLDTFNKI